MRNALPKKPKFHESAIVNLDDAQGPGTHWTAYVKHGQNIAYFDSFGDLRPPAELIKYFGARAKIRYNYKRIQNFNTYICGHLCLEFLLNNAVATNI